LYILLKYTVSGTELKVEEVERSRNDFYIPEILLGIEREDIITGGPD